MVRLPLRYQFNFIVPFSFGRGRQDNVLSVPGKPVSELRKIDRLIWRRQAGL
jgi:hypothetical protein